MAREFTKMASLANLGAAVLKAVGRAGLRAERVKPRKPRAKKAKVAKEPKAKKAKGNPLETVEEGAE